MIQVISIMMIGILMGYLSRNRRFSKLNTLLFITTVLLLFMMGVYVGANPVLLSNIQSIGWDAFVISIGAIGGSLIVAYLVYNKFFKQRN